jgi:hypothetical protein
MDTESIGKLLGGLLSGGVAGNVTLALAEGLKLANKLMEPDPAKRAKARREYYMSLIKLVKEVQDAKIEDVSAIVDAFTNLMDE